MVTLQTALGLFNIFVGLMLTASILLFFTGLIVWLIRLGTIHREEGIHIMAYAVNVLFVLVFLLAIVQFFQNHRAEATMVTAALIILIILWLFYKVATHESPKKPEKH
jgi:Ca2+/Na+ antiporter